MTSFGVAPLSDLVSSVDSGFASGENSPSGVLQIRMNNVTGDGAWDWSETRRVPASEAMVSKYQVHKGDVLFNSTNSPSLVGKSAVFGGIGESVVFSNHFLRVRTRPDRLDGSYLARWLNVLWRERLFETRCTQWVNQASFRKEDLLRLQIPLPPLAEQRRIAAILDKTDGIRGKRQKLLSLVDELESSAFRAIFGDHQAHHRHARVALGKCLRFLTSGSRGWARYYSDSGIPFLRIQNVGRNRLLLSDDLAHVTPPDDAEAERTAVRPGDVLLSITADLGRTAVIPEGFGRAHINQHLAILRFRFDEIDPVYVSAFLASPAGKAQIEKLNRGGVKAGLNFDDIRSIEIPLPSLEDQQRFRSIWKEVQVLRLRLEQASVVGDGLFNSLSHWVLGYSRLDQVQISRDV